MTEVDRLLTHVLCKNFYKHLYWISVPRHRVQTAWETYQFGLVRSRLWYTWSRSQMLTLVDINIAPLAFG
jgi:hypothetical protein